MRDEGPHIVEALELDSEKVVSIEDACSLEGERPRFSCPECGKELLARCGEKRAQHFAHRYKGTTCLGRRLSATAPSGPPGAEAGLPAPGWAPPEDPAEAAAAEAAYVREQVSRPVPQPPTSVAPAWNSPPWTPVSPPRTVAAAPPIVAPETVDAPHVNFVDVYLPGSRLLQLIAIFVPLQGGGGQLTLHLQHPERDTHQVEGAVVREWPARVTRAQLSTALAEAVPDLKKMLQAVEVAPHVGFRRAPTTDPRQLAVPAPLRGGPWARL